MFALRSASRLPRALRVEWEDGLTAQFTYVWLRDNDRQRRPSLLHLDLNATPQEVDTSSNQLSVVWPPFMNSTYSSQFLRDHSIVKPMLNMSAPTKKVLAVPWRIQERPAGEDFSHMATSQWGAVAREVGTVWPQLQKVPSLVTVESFEDEGKVHLVDAVQALSEMSRVAPDEFKFLCEHPINYEMGAFKAMHPVATIQDGLIQTAVFNNEQRSSAVPAAQVEQFYSSLKTFNKICLDSLHTVSLRRGELLVVDNSQTLVGAPAQAGRTLHLRLYN